MTTLPSQLKTIKRGLKLIEKISVSISILYTGFFSKKIPFLNYIFGFGF